MQQVKDEDFLSILGEKLRELRKSKGLTQMELGVAIGNHGEQIGRVERGEVNVSVCTLKLICEGLGISLKDLFEDHQ